MCKWCKMLRKCCNCCKPKTDEETDDEETSGGTSEVNLLLLGAAGVGKTTFLRQMEIIHGGGFNDPAKKSFTEIIFLNIFQSMKNLMIHMERMNLNYEIEINQTHCKRAKQLVYEDIIQQGPESQPSLKIDYTQMAQSLWEDDAVKECFRRRAEFRSNWVHDNLPYFMEEFNRIAGPEYIPKEQDILNMRTQTTANQYREFELVRNIKFRITDVGGQKFKRGIWPSMLRDCAVIIFLVSLADYDQNLEEIGHEGENCLVESVGLFKAVTTIAPRKSIILFLNKVDLLEQKIANSPVQNVHPEYNPAFDYVNEATSNPDSINLVENMKYFVKKQLMDKWQGNIVENNKSVRKARPTQRRGGESFRRNRNRRAGDDDEDVPTLYPHFMCATDTSIVRRVFQDTRAVIVQEAMSNLALL